jgi:hypothetical protein
LRTRTWGSTIKLLDCFGWVALNEHNLLERRAVQMFPAEPWGRWPECAAREEERRRERRRRERKRRGGPAEFCRKKRGKISLRLDELKEAMKNKSDEEIADFLFFLKEKSCSIPRLRF